MRRQLLVTLAVLAAACGDTAPSGHSNLSVQLSALSLVGVGDVVWDIRVTHGADPADVVWTRRVTSSRFGDGAGSATWVGPCDASPGAADHRIDVWVVGLYDAPVTDPGAFASGQSTGPGAVTGAAPLAFTNPTALTPLTRTATCIPNGDTPVSFDVTLMRPARQGFFDIAVSLSSIFCSAKFDCCDAPAGAGCPADKSLDRALLFTADGARDTTFVLGFACAAAPDVGTRTHLYLDALTLDCTSPSGESFSADLALDPSGPAGNQCLAGPDGMTTCAAVTEVTPGLDADEFLFQFATYRGVEDLTSGGAPLSKIYWNLALGVKRPAIASCRLRTRGTADDAANTPLVADGRVTAGIVYPYISWDIDLSACGAEPLSFDGSTMVKTAYTSLDGPGMAFHSGFGEGRVAGPFCAPSCLRGTCVAGACVCPAGFSGPACELAEDPCLLTPCQNAGVCTASGATDFTCACTGGFTGPTCETPPDPCAPNPCDNAGVCTANGPSAFTCACTGGYSGPTCQTPPDPCSPNPCDNAGACTANGPSTFTCVCTGGFTGPTCQTPPDPCSPNPCQNAGACSVQGNDFACACVGGYSGLVCETPPNPCDPDPCVRGTCVTDGEGYLCECPPTHTGTHCELEVTACTSNPCLHGGTCSLAPGGFACECANGWGGDTCEIELPCGLSGAPCPAGEFCAPGEVCVPNGTTQNSAPVAMSPASSTLLFGETQALSLSDGNAPYSVTLVSGGGDLDDVNLTYTAPAEPTTATLRVTDAFGTTADTIITTVAPLSLSPVAVRTSQATTVTASGGVGPYTFSLVTGPGSLVGNTYTAPATTGSVTLRVTDSGGRTLDAALSIYAPLAISPTSTTLFTNAATTFTTTGGYGAVTFSVVAGGGAFSSATYTAPGTAGSATVRATDLLGNTSNATVTIQPPLVISPSSATIEVNKTVTFAASGGQGPYTFTKFSGVGSVSGTVYTAPATAGTATVRVTDALARTRDATVTVIAAVGGACSPNPCLNLGVCTLDVDAELGYVCDCAGDYSGDNCEIEPPPCGTSGLPCDPGFFCTVGGACLPDGTTPNPTPVSISPTSATILVNGTRTFAASGGDPPYTFYRASGDGTVSGNTYTAPAYATTAVVGVRDAFNNTSTATVTIRPLLAISPASANIAVNGSVSFSATGGIGAYTFSKVSGGGTLAGSTYTAPATTGSATIRVTDAAGNRSDAVVTISSFAILPNAPSVVTNGTIAFSASGGTAPYTFAITAGGGSITGSTYTAPATAGTATVRVTSANGWTASTNVTIYAPLTIAPNPALVMAGANQTFTTSGGLGAISFSKPDGEGTLVGATLTASENAGAATIRATDTAGNTADAAVTVYPVLTLSPATSYVLSGDTITFEGAGGYGAKTYSVLSGGGTFTGSSWSSTGANAGLTVVRVTDSLGNTAQASIIVYGYTYVDGGGVTATGAHACGVRSDGTLWCWGQNAVGQLGDGTLVAKTTPTRVGTDADWVMVSAGDAHTCAIKTDGSLWCWGENANGRLGDATSVDKSVPTRIGAAHAWLDVAAGNAHTCGVTTAGKLFCWGYNLNGQLGTGNTTTQTAPTQVGTLTDWSSVSASGANAACATRSNGTLWCWGLNTYGNLGQNNTTQSTSPLQVSAGVTTWSSVSSGLHHVCATRTDGSLWCWGRNNFYQTGDPASTANRLVPVQIGTALGAFATVSAGAEFSCATLVSGALYCWGRNQYGQVGDNTTTNRTSPTRVGTATNWALVGVAADSACASKNDGTLYCWGWDNVGQLGVSGTATVVWPTRVSSGFTSLAASSLGHTCGVKTDNTAWCWGNAATYGAIGDGTTVSKTRPVLVAGGATNWTKTALRLGYQHSCAVRADKKLFCWGRNYRGALGNGNTTTNTSPVEVLGGTVWADSALGQYHTYGRRDDGSLYAWGRNDYGNLGLGTSGTGTTSTPTRIGTLNTWRQPAAGAHFGCATRTDGTLWCWGLNTSYQLGDNTATNRTSPVQIGTANTWTAVSAGQVHTCGLQSDGSLWCWGSNTSGRVGDGTTTTVRVPKRIGTANDWVKVAPGWTATCALKNNGTLWCWGANSYGQVGDGTKSTRLSPVQVGSDADWADVTGGYYHMCGLKTDGSVYCWGRNNYGQIGTTDKCADATLYCQVNPVRVQ